MSDDYGSHLPILEELTPCDDALEFGVGEHSTPFLLERAARLTSVETDPEWAEWATDEFGSRPNFTLTSTPPGNLERFDLILIDDGQRASDRVATLNWVLARAHGGPVVVHDANVDAYRATIAEWGYEPEVRHGANGTPWTAVIR